MNTLISMVGRTKSGKSTLAGKLARYLRTVHVETSEVVQSTGKDKAELGKELYNVIERRMETKGRTVAVISGLREIEAVEELKKHYDYYGFEVRAEVPIRYQRSLDDGKYHTADQFIRGEIYELDIGIQEVEDDAPFAIPTSPLTNPDNLIRATVKILRKKGATLR